MNNVGPAMSLRTSCWLFPQKLQYRVLRESPPDLAAGMSVTHLRLGARHLRARTQDYVKRDPGIATTSKCSVSAGEREPIGRNCPSGGSCLDGRSRAFFEHIVDQSELLGFRRREELVALHGAFDLLASPSRMDNGLLVHT